MHGDEKATGTAGRYGDPPEVTVTRTLALPPEGRVEGVNETSLRTRGGKLTEYPADAVSVVFPTVLAAPATKPPAFDPLATETFATPLASVSAVPEEGDSTAVVSVVVKVTATF